MIKNLIILFPLLVIHFSFACTCPPTRLSDKQKEEIENSEYIFIGNVIDIDKSNHTYKVQIIESLKNCAIEGVIYDAKNWISCDPYINTKGKWLIYAKMENGYLKTNLCGISRSLENPQEIISSIPPPPLNENESKKVHERKRELWKKEDKKKSKQDLENEIESLRKKKFNLQEKELK